MKLGAGIGLVVVSLTLAACGTAGPGSNDREVRTTAEIAATPERVVDAFLEPDDLSEWWKVSRSFVERKVGGIWAVTWDDYGKDRTNHVWSGVIEDIGPRRIVIRDVVMIEPGRPLFAPMRIEIVAELLGEGCKLEVIHGGYGHGSDQDWLHTTVAAGWRHVLGDLQTWFAPE